MTFYCINSEATTLFADCLFVMFLENSRYSDFWQNVLTCTILVLTLRISLCYDKMVDLIHWAAIGFIRIYKVLNIFNINKVPIIFMN